MFSLIVPSAPPTFIQVTAVDSETLLLSWSPLAPEHQNGIIRGYVINITAIESGQQLQFTSNTTSLVIDDLHPYYTYNCIVAAFSIGTGPFSEISRVQLPEDGTVCFSYALVIASHVLLVSILCVVHYNNLCYCLIFFSSKCST